MVTCPGMRLPGVSPSGPKVLLEESPLPSCQAFWIKDCSVDGDNDGVVVTWLIGLSGERSGSRNPEGGSFLQPGSPPWLVTSVGNGKERQGLRATGSLAVKASSLPRPGSPRIPGGWHHGSRVPKGAGETESQWRERETKPCLLKMANHGRQDRHGNKCSHKSNKGAVTKGQPPCDTPQHVGDRVRCT